MNWLNCGRHISHLRQQTLGWNHAEQKGKEKNYWHWVHQRACHHYHGPGKPSTHQIDECLLFPHSKCADHHIEKMYKTMERYMLKNKKCIPIIEGDFNAELLKEWNVKVLAGTLSTKVTREVTGWKAGWCQMITPRSTRCSKRRRINWRPSSFQKEKNFDQEKILEKCEGRWDQRHDPHRECQ